MFMAIEHALQCSRFRYYPKGPSTGKRKEREMAKDRLLSNKLGNDIEAGRVLMQEHH